MGNPCHGHRIHATATSDLNRAQSDLELEPVLERLTKAEARSVKLGELSAFPIHHSQGKEQPTPPDVRIHEGLSLADVQRMNASVRSALEADLTWLTEVITESISDEPVEWSGYMAKSAREQLQQKRATNYAFGLLIDSPLLTQTLF